MEVIIPSSNSLSISKPSPLFSNLHLLNLSSPHLTYRTKPLPAKPIVISKWKRKRSRSRKSPPISLQSLALLASNLRVLPEPVNFFIREFAGGNGGGRFGFGGGGSDGWGRRGERKLGFWAILVASGFLLLCIFLDRGKGRDLTWMVPILLAVVAYCLGGLGKREIRGWLIGFCCGASMLGLGLHNGNLVRFSQQFRARYRCSNPITAILGKTMRRRR